MLRPIQQFFALALALVASLSMAISVLALSPAPASAASGFGCTEVIGFSQTNNWFTEGGTFEPTVGDASWQERWYSGGSIDLWSYADGAPWYASVLSSCAAGSSAPDRVLINISGAYNSDPTWWQTQVQGVINAIANNTGHGYSNNWTNVREIILQSVVGGPGGAQCATTDTQPAVQYGINRASYNFPYINRGIDLAVAANAGLMSSSGHGIRVWHGAAPTVDSCSDYGDGVGHLSPAAKTYLGTRIGQFYASGAAPVPTSTPIATSTPQATATPQPQAAPATPTPASQPVSSSAGCPCGIFSYSGAPDTADVNDTNAVELGFKFRADTAGTITGVRFYKGPLNTGTHVGSLWTSGGQLLASGTFVNESTSGWQVMTFAAPVQIQANTVYVASYHTNVGQYAVTRNGLLNQVDYSALHALGSNAASGNGVYRYAAASAFPNQTYGASNYWVDVVFVPGVSSAVPTATSAPPTATSVPPTATATSVPPTATAIPPTATSVPTMTATSVPTSTATSVPTSSATSVPTSTATALPTQVSASGSASTVTFNGLPSPNRTLVGQEAGAGIDFGSGPWWLASAWGRFTTNSISFNGAGPTSASVKFTAPRTLVQLDAYNGGTTTSTITISSVGQTSRVVSVARDQLVTIVTGFTAPGSSVTIASSNGWDTNFDNLVVR